MDRADSTMAMTAHMLIIAGADSSGGAGIVRDIETAAHFGVKASLALTAITAQTHRRVEAMEPVNAALVADQMHAAFEANPIAAIKIGMMANAGIVSAIAEVLATVPHIPVVLDPVLASTSGTRLLSAEGISRLLERLLERCLLITPNIPELEILTKLTDNTTHAADMLLAKGCSAVLVKGGHAESALATDILYRPGELPRQFCSRRWSASLRGSGCMLASAIAANLALEFPLTEAIAAAKALIDQYFSMERP
jgi:hydroxymethylpyrimidine/phosphomethylpyrimidine kinase